MNKRLLNKKIKQVNLGRHNNIFNQIKQYFTVKNIQFLDSYFIFNFGKSAIAHFEVKEIPDWFFGIWLEENNQVKIFGQHIDVIDKFKPSQTYISETDVNKFIDILLKIKENPIYYLVDNLTNSVFVDYEERIEEDEYIFARGYQCVHKYDDTKKIYVPYRDKSITQESFVSNYYQKHLNEKMEKENEDKLDRKNTFEFLNSLKDKFDSIVHLALFDENINGVISSPRYKLRLVVNDNVSYKEMGILLEQVEDLIWDYNKQNHFWNNHLVSLYDVTTDNRILKETHYRF